MNMDEILTLVQAVSDSKLTSFKLDQGDMHISLKKEKEEAEIFGRLFVKLRKNLVEVKSKLSQEASEGIDFLIGLIDESEISRTSYYFLYKEALEIIL